MGEPKTTFGEYFQGLSSYIQFLFVIFEPVFFWKTRHMFTCNDSESSDYLLSVFRKTYLHFCLCNTEKEKFTWRDCEHNPNN
jgi:hypothetical protein